MIVLSAATYTLQLVLSAGTADVDVSYVDRTATAYPIGGTEQTAATATTQTICSAPAASTSREIDFLSVKIKTTGGVVTVQKLNSSGSVTTQLISVTLLDEEVLQYTHAGGWCALDANGNRKEVTASNFGAITATSITDSGLTSGRVVYAGTGGLLQDSANLTFNGTTLTANTIGAFILSGNVTSTGNPSLNLGSGALTVGAITSSGVINTFNAAGAYLNFSSGGNKYIGDASAVIAGGANTDLGLSSGGSVVIGAGGSLNAVATFAATSITTAAGVTSLAFNAGNPSLTIGTGALTAGAMSASSTVSATASTNGAFQGLVAQNTSTGTSARSLASVRNDAARNVNIAYLGSNWSGTFLTGGPTTESAAIYTDGNYPISIGVNSAEVGRFTSTGLNNTVIGATTAAAGSFTTGTFSGDIAVNGGDLTTSATTFNLINATATTVNIAGGATTATNIGNASGPTTVAGDLVGSKTIRTAGYTVGTLPAGTTGMRAYVTDATAPAYNTALTGGGAVTVPVFYNGAAWVSA